MKAKKRTSCKNEFYCSIRFPSQDSFSHTCRRRLGPLKNRCTTEDELVRISGAKTRARRRTPHLKRAHSTHQYTLAETEHEDPPLRAPHSTDLNSTIVNFDA